ncbi:hypothetical protein J437_LFUL006393 [Ladona fulva]|uniref:peptidyl-tRNA hydrolase n=1 Tax=Ladona fulva TaxID=123851 RepID=A0A8K0NXW9_LADFU|nr:hypothetical protein J437_LFUL006393 [Ladona fulva]
MSPQLKEKLKPNENTESAEVKVEMLCVINPETALNATTLAIECSRATVKIMEELQKDKWRKLYEDWTKYGKSVNVYQTDGALHLYHLQEKLLHDGHLSYLAEVPNPHSPDLLLPVVLCILTRTNDVRKIYPRLSKVN